VNFLELDIDPSTEPWREEVQNGRVVERKIKRGVMGQVVIRGQNHSKVELGSVKHDEDSDKLDIDAARLYHFPFYSEKIVRGGKCNTFPSSPVHHYSTIE
jgi:hypothetical protein